jgi:hypothetical protein
MNLWEPAEMNNLALIVLLYVAVISIAFNVKQYFSHKVWVALVAIRIGESASKRLGLRSGLEAHPMDHEAAQTDM